MCEVINVTITILKRNGKVLSLELMDVSVSGIVNVFVGSNDVPVLHIYLRNWS